jgi:hypothetical protein
MKPAWKPSSIGYEKMLIGLRLNEMSPPSIIMLRMRQVTYESS